VNTLCFLYATRANYYMTEVLDAVAAAARRGGVATEVCEDAFPDLRPDAVFVVIPHEFFPLVPDGGYGTPAHLRQTIGICVEQPGTQWFETTCRFGAQLGGMLAIHESACRELRRRGIAATHFPLGYAPEWDAWGGGADDRPIDVVYLGSYDERRARLLAGYADTLWTRTQRIVLARHEPKPGPGPSFIVGTDKHELLRSSKLILNLHRQGVNGLEWVRVLEAICNGAVVVTEHSRDCAPLIPGTHFVSCRPWDLGLLADLLLDDPERLTQIRTTAYEFVRDELPLERSVDLLLTIADDLPAASSAPRDPQPNAVSHGPDEEFTARVATAVRDEVWPLRAAVKGLMIEVMQTRRTLSRLEHATTSEGRLEPVVVAETEAYETVRPRVSVVISVHNYEEEIVDALESVVSSEHDCFEVLVLDDASSDRSVEVVSSFLADRPWLPAVLLRHRSNQGLGRTRNALVERARGALVFTLDADNVVYPTALARLEASLHDNPLASLAYAIAAVVVDGEPDGLVSAHAWHPTWLRTQNYIDAMAMLRRDALIEIGGYCEDPRMTGHEDYDLWCRLADAGQHGVHVPEILTTYRSRPHGMLESISNIDDTVCRSLIMARAPRLFSPAFADDPYVAGGTRAGRSATPSTTGA
jgi:hypothetical protein